MFVVFSFLRCKNISSDVKVELKLNVGFNIIIDGSELLVVSYQKKLEKLLVIFPLWSLYIKTVLSLKKLTLNVDYYFFLSFFSSALQSAKLIHYRVVDFPVPRTAASSNLDSVPSNSL